MTPMDKALFLAFALRRRARCDVMHAAPDRLRSPRCMPGERWGRRGGEDEDEVYVDEDEDGGGREDADVDEDDDEEYVDADEDEAR